MGPALGFIVGAIGLMLVVVIVLALSLWRGARAAQQTAVALEPQTAQANTAVYRDQLEEMEREYLAGAISQRELNAARDELARRLLEDVQPEGAAHAASAEAPVFRKPWGLAAALVLLVPVLAVLLYAQFGQPLGLDPQRVAQGSGAQAEITPEKLTEMATALTRRLQDEPSSVEGWVMLGRVQRARGHFDEADAALLKALALTQDDDLQIERAEVLAQKNGGNFAGEPWAIVQRVLTRDPHHLNALLLAGSASFAELNFRSALRFWERAREQVDPQSHDAQELDRAMAEAREKLGLPPMPDTTQIDKAKSAAKSISGRVSVVSELASKVAPTDFVFIYAVPVSGSHMPVALLRTTADKLPLDFMLDDSMAMTPQARLSDMDEVTLRVRISRSGQAKAQPGDLGVSLSPVKPGSQGLNLTVRDTLR